MNTNVRRRKLLAVLGVLSSAAVLGGCNNAGEGALSGGALGALAGMGIGSVFGDMGKGAAIGAIGGAIGGAVLGDQNARNNRSY
jgi:hypothetical protein